MPANACACRSRSRGSMAGTRCRRSSGPGLLCDLEGYDAWERACIATFARSDLGWRTSLDHIAAATERVRRWEPGRMLVAVAGGGRFATRAPEHGADLARAQPCRSRPFVRSLTPGPPASSRGPTHSSLSRRAWAERRRITRPRHAELSCRSRVRELDRVPGSRVALDRGVAAHLRGGRAPSCDGSGRTQAPALTARDCARKLPRR